MQVPALDVHLAWRSPAPPARVRARLTRELRDVAWSLSEMEALLHDAHRAVGLDAAYLLPRIELQLPLFDMGRRFRVVLTHVDRARIEVRDEKGRHVAAVTLV